MRLFSHAARELGQSSCTVFLVGPGTVQRSRQEGSAALHQRRAAQWQSSSTLPLRCCVFVLGMLRTAARLLIGSSDSVLNKPALRSGASQHQRGPALQGAMALSRNRRELRLRRYGVLARPD